MLSLPRTIHHMEHFCTGHANVGPEDERKIVDTQKSELRQASTSDRLKSREASGGAVSCRGPWSLLFDG